jgi:hypothetical protein
VERAVKKQKKSHFVRVTEHFMLHQTQRDPLRQGIRRHSFHFLPLKTHTEHVWLLQSHPDPNERKKKKKKKV